MGNDQSRRHRGRSRTGDSDSVSSGPGRRVGGGGGLDLGDLERLAADGAEIAITVGKAGLEKTREFSQQKEVEDVLEKLGALCGSIGGAILGEAPPPRSRRPRGRYDSDDEFSRDRPTFSDDEEQSRDTNDYDSALDVRRGGGGRAFGRGSRNRSDTENSEFTYDDTSDSDSRLPQRSSYSGAVGGRLRVHEEVDEESTDFTGSFLTNGVGSALTGPTQLTDSTSAEPTGPVAGGPAGISGMTQPLASSFAKRCYFTKTGIGKNMQHYEGLTLTGNVVLMQAAAMKLNGCPTICDEDLRRVEQTYPNQFSRLPDELLLSSGWRRISKNCHFSNTPIPDGMAFFHSRTRCLPGTGGYYFLAASAVGMVRPADVEPLTSDLLVLLQTDYPAQCDAATSAGGDAAQLVEDPSQWTLVNKFCFFSGGPINTEEDVYYRATLEGNEIYMLAFLSISLTPEELYRLGRRIINADATVTYEKVEKKAAALPTSPGNVAMVGGGVSATAVQGSSAGVAAAAAIAAATASEDPLTSVQAVEEVEQVYDLSDRDFADLRLYHLGPCRALPDYLLRPEAWTKVVPPRFRAAKEEALRRVREIENRVAGTPAALAARTAAAIKNSATAPSAHPQPPHHQNPAQRQGQTIQQQPAPKPQPSNSPFYTAQDLNHPAASGQLGGYSQNAPPSQYSHQMMSPHDEDFLEMQREMEEEGFFGPNSPRANPAPMFGQQSRREGLEPPEDPPEEMGYGRSFGRLPDDGRVPPSYSGNSDNDDIDLVISVDDGEDYTAASPGYTEDGAHTYDGVSPRSGQYYGEEQEDYSHDGESQFTGQYTSESRGDHEYDPSPGPPVSSATRGPNHFFHKSRERRLLMSSHGFGGRRYGAKLSESNSDPTVEGIGSSLKNDTDGSSMIDVATSESTEEEVVPTGRRALILQMAKARRMKESQREQEEQDGSFSVEGSI